MQFPEVDGEGSPIEMVCDIGGQKYAFEHTGIEPFAGHVKLSASAGQRIDPIKQRLEGKLPFGEDFQLHIRAGVLSNLKKSDLAGVHATLVNWIEGRAPTLPIAPRGRFVLPICWEGPPGVPFVVSLRRSEPLSDVGEFSIVHEVSSSGESHSRAARLQEACERKIPKLLAWGEMGARTVLVLENNDIQLTNAQAVFDTLISLGDEFAEWPDEIYLVSSLFESRWYVHPLKVDNLGYYDLCADGREVYKVDPKVLADITGRIVT